MWQLLAGMLHRAVAPAQGGQREKPRPVPPAAISQGGRGGAVAPRLGVKDSNLRCQGQNLASYR
jgi:hypothetical protein